MKRFFIKIALIIIPFIVLLLLINYIFSKSYWWNVYYTDKDKFNTIPDNIQLANVGSSHGVYSFDYEDFPEYITMNMGMNLQLHKYNYYLLKQYINSFSKNSILLIPVSYFEINRIGKEPVYKYYKILEKKNFPDWNIKDFFLYDIFPFFSTKEPWKKLLINESNSPVAEYERIQFTQQLASENSKIMYETFTQNYAIEKGEEGFRYNIEAISRIIDFCYDHEIIPVLVSTPQILELNELYAQTGFFETFYRFTDVLKQKYPELIYLDYSHTKEYSSDYSLFFDAMHLNKKGRKKFTAQIVQDLKNAVLHEREL